ncbi:hypothetical protein Sste5346_010278 [Sporothrix stenoceras]|uniref:Ribosomal protein/NADH dehydrogenase domain-containing protein n=1 Tax=Sporothrix stenoceras TaxID=5173 RepID=A0ABR3YGR8_9PEZI
MVGVIRRMNKLNALLNIRNGPGAVILPKEVTRIHLEFASRWNDGQYGPRKFWHNYLPRLKFWNPAIPMIVNRTQDTAGPATLTIYMLQNKSKGAPTRSPVTPDNQPNSSFTGSSKAPKPTPAETTVEIDMKGLHSDVILHHFLEKTGAVAVTPSPQDVAALREAEERTERAKVDRDVMARYLFAKKRDASAIAQAKSEAASMRQPM